MAVGVTSYDAILTTVIKDDPLLSNYKYLLVAQYGEIG